MSGFVATERSDPVGQNGIAALPDNWPDVSDICGSGKRIGFWRADDQGKVARQQINAALNGSEIRIPPQPY